MKGREEMIEMLRIARGLRAFEVVRQAGSRGHGGGLSSIELRTLHYFGGPLRSCPMIHATRHLTECSFGGDLHPDSWSISRASLFGN